MNVLNTEEIRLALNDMLDLSQWDNPVAATLHFRRSKAFYSPLSGYLQFAPISRSEASKNTTFFLRRLNQAVYKSAARRYGKSLKVVAVYEGGGNGIPLHVH